MNQTERARQLVFADKVALTFMNLLMQSVMLTLKDPTVMGHNTLGIERMHAFWLATQENYNQMLPAFDLRHPERGYARDFIARKMRQLHPMDGNVTFEDIFPDANSIKEYIPQRMKLFAIKENTDKREGKTDV